MRTLDAIFRAVLAFLGWLWRVIRAGTTWYWGKLNPAGRVGVLVLTATTCLFAWAWWTKPAPAGPGTGSAPVTVEQPVTFFSNRVVYVTKEGKPVTIVKPPESTPSVDPNGTLHVPQWGLCAIPKAGALWLPTDPTGVKPFVAFRLAYWHRYGVEAGASTAGPLVGLDARLPVLNAVTASVGTCPALGLPFNAWRPYLGAAVFVRY